MQDSAGWQLNWESGVETEAAQTAGQDGERPGPERQRQGLHQPTPKTHTPDRLQGQETDSGIRLQQRKPQNLTASLVKLLNEDHSSFKCQSQKTLQ